MTRQMTRLIAPNLRYMVHAIWAISPPLGLMALTILLSITSQILLPSPIGTATATLLALGSVVLLCDTLARLREFRQIAGGSYPMINGSIYDMVWKMRRSWCQRTACTAGLSYHHWGDLPRGLYQAHGYRWYHIFPDGAWTRRSPFISGKFWLQTIFFWKNNPA